jgi:D-glycero-alpha-D-manno-heptose 1-phosphate guanylyltransferase
MVIKEAIILAGGLGTRLRTAVPDLPKCMAPVNEKPFLTYVINYLQNEGVIHFIFSLGYKSEAIIALLEKDFPSMSYTTSVEEEPLGTGGAVKKALSLAKDKSVLITNGDTLYNIDAEILGSIHSLSGAWCTIALKPMQNFDRYGVVEIDECSVIKSFKEKQFYESGLINGGIYALHRNKFLEENLPDKFSFEKDYLEKFYKKRRMLGVVQDEYFIDIGIPEDYERAQTELVHFLRDQKNKTT